MVQWSWVNFQLGGSSGSGGAMVLGKLPTGRLFCFGSLVILDVARCYMWLFTLYINIKIGKIVVKC